MDDLIGEWRATRREWAAANAAGKSVRYRNRIHDRIWDLGHRIAEHPENYDEMVALCAIDQEPDVRIGAALAREHFGYRWCRRNVDFGDTRLGRFDCATRHEDERARIRTHLNRGTAAMRLFNIDTGRGNTGLARTS